MILPVDQNVGTCLVKGSTRAPLRTFVLLRDPPQEPAKEQSGAAAADRTPTPKPVTEPPNTKSKNTQENSRNRAMFSLTVSSRTRKRKALSRFVSASGEKGHPYFQCLRRNNKFAWTKECEEAFVKLKEYLASPPVLCKPLVGTPLKLYFVVTERAVSAVLAQDQDQAQKPIYFVSKVLQGPETRYQALEKAALVVVFSARRLRHYFHSFTILVMTNLPIQKVLKKPDVAGRMVKWAVELSEFDIKYEPQGPIKGQIWWTVLQGVSC